jgi:very-short-patch-repair endonuclease
MTTDATVHARAPCVDRRGFDAVIRAQAGVFRLRQVAPFVSLEQARHAVRVGKWQRPHRGVLVAHNGELTREQELWVCVLAAPPGSALGGLTAAELGGLQQFTEQNTYLVVPLKSRRPTRPGLVVKTSGELSTADVHPSQRPTRTRMSRSLVDGASWQRRDERARGIILAGVQQRVVRPDDLRDALRRRGPCRHRELICQSIDDAEGGIASVPEHDFEQVRRMFGLPEPQRQAVVVRSDGRYYLDADWQPFRVSAEVHGTQHMEIRTWDTDLDRQAILAAQGRRVLQFSSYAVRHRKQQVGTLLVAALRNGGWSG